MRGVALTLALLLIMGGASAAYFWKEISARLTTTQVDLNAPAGNALNILTIGSDSRSGTRSPEDVKRFGKVDGRRADTIILAQIVPSQKRAVLVHFPRDLWVPIAGGKEAKINSAYDRGPQTLIDTVQDLTGVRINHYVEVDINGFRNLVNAVGGIDVCVDRAMRDSVLNFRLPAGPSHLDGNTALSFVRARHADPDGDFGRIRRQQQFLRAVVAKVGKPTVILNPIRMRNMANAFAANVTTDQDLALGELLRLAPRVRSVGPDQIETFTVPGDISRAGSQSIVAIDQAKAERLFGALRAAADPKEALAPAPIEVSIDDASGRSVAATVASDLGARGFTVIEQTEVVQARTRTSVVAPRRLANDAKRVLALVPGARLEYGGTEIRLVLGTSFKGLTPPPKGEAPAPGGPCARFNAGG